MKSIALAICLIFFYGSISAFSEEIVFPQGPERDLTAADFFRYSQSNTNYNEIWRYSFVFNSGTKVFLSYSLMSIPFLGTNCGINISFYNFKGNNYQVGREYPEDCFIERKEADAGIHIRTGSENNIFFMAGYPGDGHHVVFNTLKNQGFLLDLTFSNPLPGKVVGDGMFKLGRQKIGLYVHIPEGPVKGTIGIGNDTINVEGSGYMEHLRHTKPPLDLATFSLQLYGEHAPYAGNIFAGSEKHKFTPYGYVIDKNTGKILFPKEIKSGKENALNDMKSIGKMRVTWLNHPMVIIIKNQVEHQRYSFLSTMDGWASKQAARFFMGGEVMSLRGISHVNLQPTHYCLFYVK